MDHKSKDAHHGGSAVVQLDTALDVLLLLGEFAPCASKGAVPEVTDELVSGALNVLHDSDLKETDERKDLNKSPGRDGIRSEEGGKTVRVRVERVSRVVDVSAKVDSSTGGDLSKECKHCIGGSC